MRELVYLIIQIIFSQINLFGFLSPVGLPFAFVRLFIGDNIFIVTFGYLVSRAFFFGELSVIFITIYEIVFLALYYLCKEFLKTKKQLLLCLAFSVVSSALSLYYSIFSLELIVKYLINLVLQVLILIYFYKFNLTYKNKFVFYRFSNYDYLMFSCFILFISLGLFSISFIEWYLGLFLLTAITITFARILPADKYFLLVGFMAVGAGIVTLNYFYLTYVFLLSICMLEFKTFNKYVHAMASAVILGIFCIIFNISSIFQIISMYFAVFIYICLPNKIISRFSDMFEAGSLNLIYKYVEQHRTTSIKNRLMLMSDTLSDMQREFKFLLVGKIDRDVASTELSQDIINKCCGNCENFQTCLFGNINKREQFESMIRFAINNRQIERNDLTNGLEAYCSKSGIVVSEINQIAKQFLAYESTMKNEDASKLIISNEFGNFADIFANFAKIINKPLKINEKLSTLLKERCLNNLLDVKEILIAESETGIESINVIASNEHILKRELASCISKVTKNNIAVKEIKHLDYSGLSLATFIPSSKLKINFAISTKSKESKNGDNTIISKIADNKYFIAIADGMGHGESANRISSMVLSLIRSLFEVGLDDELILQSVNKLLIPAGLDNFTTLDACVIDLDKNVCNFIKLGSSVSVIKHYNTSELVSCESLPIGIVQNIKPTIIKKQITAGDTIFLASDGIVDAFTSIEHYKSYINDSRFDNLQGYVDELLFDVQNQNLAHPDDMTIIAINLLKN